MKKNTIVICSVLFTIMLGAGIIIYSMIQKDNHNQEDVYYTVESFNLNESPYLLQAIQDFPSNKYLGETLIADDAVKKAVSEWSECGIFSKEEIDRKPYCVSFDSKNEIWYITGSVPKNMKARLPHILIQKGDGKVLAVWGH